MKKLLALLFMTVCMISVKAETYQIKYLNTPTVNIGGKNLTVGDSFNSSETINWASDRQAMKVLSGSNKVYVLSKNLMAKQNAKSFSDYIVSVKSATVRNDGKNFPVTLADHKAIFENDFILLDSISLKVGWSTNDSSYFEAHTNNLGADNFSFTIPTDGENLIITRENFHILPSDCCDISLTIKYVEKDYNDITDITDSMVISLMPLNCEEE